MPEPLVGGSRRRGRPTAWIYYAIITVFAMVAGFSAPAAFLLVPFTGLYARYLYRGGSVVVWFW